MARGQLDGPPDNPGAIRHSAAWPIPSLRSYARERCQVAEEERRPGHTPGAGRGVGFFFSLSPHSGEPDFPCEGEEVKGGATPRPATGARPVFTPFPTPSRKRPESGAAGGRCHENEQTRFNK